MVPMVLHVEDAFGLPETAGNIVLRFVRIAAVDCGELGRIADNE